MAAKFKPPKLWMYLVAASEALLAIALIFGIFVTVAGAIAAFHLAVAAVAVYRLTGKYVLPVLGDLLLVRRHALLSCRRYLALMEAKYST